MTEENKKDDKKQDEIKKEKSAEKETKPNDEQKKEEKGKVKKGEKQAIPELKPGMTVRIHQKIKELNIKGEEKERIQYFEGLIIAMKHGKEAGASITVRKISDGIGVEKIFPLHLPTITKIEIKKQVKVKRAKLYFLKRGYKKKLKEKKEKK